MTEEATRYRPWLDVPAEDYEGHMDSPSVGQLAALSGELAEAYRRSLPERMLVIGCATGNGFEHVDAALTERLVGLDVNPRYLEVARERFGDSHPGLELIRADVDRHEFEPDSFDLIHAGLVLEYLRPDRLLRRMAGWLAADGWCSVVIQLPDDELATVSETGFESLRALAPVMRLLTGEELESLAVDAGFDVVTRREIPLPNGKRLLSLGLRRVE